MKVSAILKGFVFAAAIAGASTVATAQSDRFDARAFFDKQQAEGRSFDSKAFFDRLQAEGKSNADAQKLFDKLQAEGKSSGSFDSTKLWDKLQAEGRTDAATAMMIGSGPTTTDCAQAWSASSRWDEAMFNKMCKR